MMRRLLVIGLLGYWVIGLSGCVVRTYPLTKDRVDQDLTSGNRGYLKGQTSESGITERKATRTTQVLEIELYSPVKFEKKPKIQTLAEKTEDRTLEGNRGYLTESIVPEVIEPMANFEKYTVKKGDTLQIISKKFYGTTKRWKDIYEANKETLKGPNKIYPGTTINIPAEGLKESKENLK